MVWSSFTILIKVCIALTFELRELDEKEIQESFPCFNTEKYNGLYSLGASCCSNS